MIFSQKTIDKDDIFGITEKDGNHSRSYGISSVTKSKDVYLK